MRLIWKTLSWRIIATSLSMVVAYLLTGSLKIAGMIGASEAVIKSVAYYIHELVWTAKPED